MTKTTSYKMTLWFAFILAFISPPFIFGQMDIVSREIRLFFGLIVILLLILKMRKIKTYDLAIFSCIAFFLGFEILRGISEQSNILSYYAVVVVYVLLFITLRDNELKKEVFLKLWIHFAYFMSISSIIMFVLHQFTSWNTDFLHFASHCETLLSDLRYSLLGTTFVKNFGFFTMTRSQSYFIEPQHTAFYFTINVMLAREINKNGRHKKYLFCNLLAGLLTFSVTFYIAIIIIYIMRTSARKNKSQLTIMTIALLLVILPLFIFDEDILFTLFGNSLSTWNISYADRVIRTLNALDILRSSSVFNFLFGHGVSYTGDADRALSIGFFHILVERGLTGLLFVLGMMGVFLRKNFLGCLICLLYLFAFTWYVNYIFWMGILALWAGVSIAKSETLDVNKLGAVANHGELSPI